jgi:hypothetical protein
MDWLPVRIKSLREILANLYPLVVDARKIVVDAGMNPAQIAFDNKAIVNWFNILEQAKFQDGKIDVILKLVLDEYPNVEALKLIAANTPAPQARGPEAADWHGPAGSQVERIIGQRSTLVSITYLELGLLRSKSVARVCLPDGSCGTGFLTADDILITNNHVLSSAEEARTAVAQFNFQQTLNNRSAGMEQYSLLPDAFFRTSRLEENDWTAVKVSGNPSEKWGAIELKPTPLKVGDPVNIIQHPAGGPKQVSFNANVVMFVGDQRIQYLTDTLPGSSGSPVFDIGWSIVALHHSGGWLAEPNAPPKTTYYRNEGIPIVRIIDGLAMH